MLVKKLFLALEINAAKTNKFKKKIIIKMIVKIKNI